MESIRLFGGVSAVLLSFDWLVHLAGAIVALVFLIRRRNAASVLALVGFGLPVLTAPMLAVLRYLLAQRLIMERAAQSMLAINTVSSLVGIVSSLCLVVAFWLAFKDHQSA